MKKSQVDRIALNPYIEKMMRQCMLLQPLEDEQFNVIMAKSHVSQLSDDSILFEHGGPLTHVYLLISGGIKLQRITPNGDEKVIEIIRPQQTFAEAVLFSGGSRYPVTAVSVSTSVVVCIHAETYLSLLNTSNSLCMNLLSKLSQRLHWMVNEMDRLTLHNATFRLIDYLLSHNEQDRNGNMGVNLAAPKHVIASRLSIKPETLSRTLKSLSKQGLIRLEGSQIELLEIEKLQALISLES